MKQDALKKKQMYTERMEDAIKKRPMFWAQGEIKEEVAKKLTKLGIKATNFAGSNG